jgi:hypothetical protein
MRRLVVVLAVAGVAGCGDNDPPPDLDDVVVTTEEDRPVTFTIEAREAPGDEVALAVEAPSYGTFAQDRRTLTYTPDPDFHGEEHLAMTATVRGRSAVAALRIVVTPVNDDPVAVDDAVTRPAGAPVALAAALLLANDYDVDGDPLEVIAVGDPVGGTVTLSGTSITLSPEPELVGTARFVYTIGDGQGGRDTATVTVTLTAAAP